MTSSDFSVSAAVLGKMVRIRSLKHDVVVTGVCKGIYLEPGPTGLVGARPRVTVKFGKDLDITGSTDGFAVLDDLEDDDDE